MGNIHRKLLAYRRFFHIKTASLILSNFLCKKSGQRPLFSFRFFCSVKNEHRLNDTLASLHRLHFANLPSAVQKRLQLAARAIVVNIDSQKFIHQPSPFISEIFSFHLYSVKKTKTVNLSVPFFKNFSHVILSLFHTKKPSTIG